MALNGITCIEVSFRGCSNEALNAFGMIRDVLGEAKQQLWCFGLIAV
jgi:hypothetical protein